MRNRIFLLSTGLLLLMGSVQSGLYAQTTSQPCATDQKFQEHIQADPALRVAERQMEEWVMNQNAKFKTEADDTTTYVIPVVFHIIHNNGPENISKTFIDQQIITLNDAYTKNNFDTLAVRPAFKSLISNAHIRFQLATQDPWGNCTNGVTRVVSSQTTDAGDNVKSLAWWDNTKYLNIWVVKSIAQPSGLQGTIAGYAQFPWEAGSRASTDGIILNYQFVGKGQKTLPHEVGHFLGLYHTFQDGCSDDQSLQGDHVTDTPPVAEASYGYNVTANTCHADVPDLPDMIENYMDYADRKYMFTPKQVSRMRSYLKSTRASLISQSNIQYTLLSCAVTGISEPQHTVTSLTAYPNPAHDRLEVRMTTQKAALCQITLTDIAGKVLYSIEKNTVSGGENVFNLDLSTLVSASGIYILHVTSPDEVLQQKILVQK